MNSQRWTEKIDIIVPAYNEEENVGLLAGTLILQMEKDGIPFHLIIVNDGSKDGTLSRAKVLAAQDDRIEVISHEKNMGLGAALRTGFVHVKSRFVITIDCDLSYHPRQIRHLLPPLRTNHAAFGSPYMKQGKVQGVGLLRLLPSIGVNFCYSAACARRLSCWTGMFRGYQTKIAKKLDFRSDGFEAVAEIAVWLSKNNYRIVEVPSVLEQRKHGVSKMSVKREFINHLRQLARIMFSKK